MRRKDWHILTVGRNTYTTDARFRVLHREGTLDWLLEIKFVEKTDSGFYECQVEILMEYFATVVIFCICDRV